MWLVPPPIPSAIADEPQTVVCQSEPDAPYRRNRDSRTRGALAALVIEPSGTRDESKAGERRLAASSGTRGRRPHGSRHPRCLSRGYRNGVSGVGSSALDGGCCCGENF